MTTSRYRFVRLLAIVALALVCSKAAAEFLEPAEAFRFSATPIDGGIAVRYDIADGYYLYRERFKFALDPAASAGATLGAPEFPKGEVKYDETFGKDVEHYRRRVVVRLPVTGATGPVTIVSTSQGCADAGLCYPPQVARATVVVGGAASGPPGGAVGDASGAARTHADALRALVGADGASESVASRVGESRASSPDRTIATERLDDASRIERTLAARNLGWIALLFVGLGVLLAFTPCVLPMVPILSAILVGHDARDGGRAGAAPRSRGFALAVAYSLGLAVVYTALGIAAGLAGEGLAAALQTPWILGVFAALLVGLSLSMFGVYELQVPAGVQARLSAWSGRVGGGRGASVSRLAGVFAMGATSALIVGPCVAAPLAGALLYISRTRDVVVGGVALFSLAVGMSVPLLLLGLSAQALLPKVGAWMEGVKRFFGVLLIAVAIWMVAPILPTWIAMLAWAVFAVVVAVWLRVFDALAPEASAGARLAKGLGVVLLLAGAVEFVGVATGGRDVLQPLAHLARDARPAADVATATVPFERVKTAAELDARVASAGRPVLLDFTADWCVSCREMERFTYADARVADRLKDFVLLKADVTANDADDRALLKRFGLFGPPGIVFFDRAGRPLTGAGVVGFQDADRFLGSLAIADPRS